MKWTAIDNGDLINLDNIAYIWIHESSDGFFLMGEMIHNGEEIIISSTVDSKHEAIEMIKEVLDQIEN